MDANKLKKLQEVGYTIKRTCFNCAYVASNKVSSGFSTCNKFGYRHLKHADSFRRLSTHMSGCCTEHEWDADFLNFIHGFAEFKER